MIQIAALRSRLEKQPTDLRRNPRDLGDGALVTTSEQQSLLSKIMLVGQRSLGLEPLGGRIDSVWVKKPPLGLMI